MSRGSGEGSVAHVREVNPGSSTPVVGRTWAGIVNGSNARFWRLARLAVTSFQPDAHRLRCLETPVQ